MVVHWLQLGRTVQVENENYERGIHTRNSCGRAYIKNLECHQVKVVLQLKEIFLLLLL